MTQGDPLSPFLFILMVEGMGNMIKTMWSLGLVYRVAFCSRYCWEWDVFYDKLCNEASKVLSFVEEGGDVSFRSLRNLPKVVKAYS